LQKSRSKPRSADAPGEPKFSFFKEEVMPNLMIQMQRGAPMAPPTPPVRGTGVGVEVIAPKARATVSVEIDLGAVSGAAQLRNSLMNYRVVEPSGRAVPLAQAAMVEFLPSLETLRMVEQARLGEAEFSVLLQQAILSGLTGWIEKAFPKAATPFEREVREEERQQHTIATLEGIVKAQKAAMSDAAKALSEVQTWVTGNEDVATDFPNQDVSTSLTELEKYVPPPAPAAAPSAPVVAKSQFKPMKRPHP
jgi:hypothetical protein